MIPPSRLQATIRPRSLSTPSLPSHLQTRSFFGWKRSLLQTWDSKSDPSYNRARRYRTLQTRAKLLKNVRRRSQYYWDADAKPYFTFKPEHIRYASHWQLGGRPPRWSKAEAEKEKAEQEEKDKEDYELTKRERVWKEQMEAMRRKIESDPYEAVFGKRFEPFWGPLVPTWMRDEMGLPREDEKTKTAAENVDRRPIDVRKAEVKARAPERKDSGVYSYSSGGSWDSKSNQMQWREWDSASENTSNYAYDPVSGRMMPVEARKSEAVKAPEPKALAKAAPRSLMGEQMPAEVESSLDSLTARDVRASVGKVRKMDSQASAQESESKDIEQQLKDFNASSERLRSQIAGIVDHATTAPFINHLQSSLQRHAETPNNHERAKPLQPAVQRMQSKPQPIPSEYDDSAVHEATEPSPSTPNLPKSWNNQAELLQAERVKRTTSSRPSPTQRWLDDMTARKAAYDANKAAKQASSDAATASERLRLQKANDLLQTEVEAQKTAMRQHEERYTHKIRSLRAELDTAYKQSSVHADEFKDQISKLEKRLASAQRAAEGSGLRSTEQRYREKVRILLSELDVAYKQSSIHAYEFTQRIKTLEAELARANKAAGGEEDAQTVRKPELKAMQGEGDFCTNVTKYADSGKWYKQPSTMPQVSNEEVARAEQNIRDRALVRNVRQIYEKTYGAIDAAHRQGAVTRDDPEAGAYEEIESKGQYSFKPDGLGSELQGKSCGDVLQGNAAKKQAKAAQKDVSEVEKPFVQNEEPGQYSFKADDLASELEGKKGCGDALQGNAVKKQAKVAQKDISEVEKPFVQNEEPGQYSFKSDGLASELKNTGCGDALQGNAAKKLPKTVIKTPVAVVDSSDAYEAAVGGKPTVQIQAPEPAETNDLEAELKGLGEQQPAYASDDYEAQVSGKITASTSPPKKVQSFAKDDLEAELKSKGKETTAYASDEYEAAASTGQPKIRASTTIDKSKVGNDLEAELKSQGREQPEYASDAYEAAALHTSTLPLRTPRQRKTQDLSAEPAAKGKETPDYAATTTTPTWAHPPLYLILVRESTWSASEFSETSTTSHTVSAEEPLAGYTLTEVLAKLEKPALYAAKIGQLQGEGWQVVSVAKGDVVVFRKVDVENAEKKTQAEEMMRMEKVVVEAERNAGMKGERNPVDGMGKRDVVKPCTGNFASPTGFVNFDDAFRPERKGGEKGEAQVVEKSEDYTSPRIKRAEAVYSGARLAPSSGREARISRRAARRAALANAEAEHGGRAQGGVMAKVALGSVALCALAYVSGNVESVAQRKKREELRSPGGGAEMGVGRGRKWVLDEGEWKAGRS